MLTRLDRYVLRNIAAPLLAVIGIAALLLILERMLRLFDFVINEGGPVTVVFRMLGNLLPQYVALALPVGLFLGTLLAIRKLSLSSELDAMLASGVGLGRMLRPVMALAILLMLVNIGLTGLVQPLSRYAYRNLVYELRSGALGASIKTGTFVRINGGYILRIGASKKHGSELYDIFIEHSDKQGRRQAISAPRGGFFSTSNQSFIILRLYDGGIADLHPGHSLPRILTFRQQDVQIRLPRLRGYRERGDEKLEMTLDELWRAYRKPKTGMPDHRAVAAAFHRQIAISFTFLFLPPLAMALGVTRKRNDRTLGISIGIFMLVTLNQILKAGENLAAGGSVPVFVSVWVPTLVFSALSLRLFYLAAHKAGAEPLGGLETVWRRLRAPIDAITERMRKEIIS